MSRIDKAFAWTWVAIAAFLFGCFLGPMGIDVLDTAGALLLLAGGVIMVALAARLAKTV